jgi:predicted GNAT family acetyltransferase
MRATVTRDPAIFEQRAAGFLHAAAIENNVVATVLATIIADPAAFPDAVFGWAEDPVGEIGAAVVRTPPRALLGAARSRAAAKVLMALLLGTDPDPPSVIAAQPSAQLLADAWRTQTGGSVATGMTQTIYALDAVARPERPAAGSARTAAREDRALIVDWLRAFSADVGFDGGDEAAITDRRIALGQLVLWHDRAPVALAGVHVPVAGVVRIGPVYTPPAWRRRGYATAVVAAVSAAALTGGAAACMLFADAADPTANGIYRAIGYREVGAAQEYRLHR